MNIAYINDLHIDHHIKYNKNKIKYYQTIENFIINLINKSQLIDFDVLIISGDLSHYNDISKLVLKTFSQYFNIVFFVPGNHDYYLISKNQLNKHQSSYNRIKNLISQCYDLKNVIIFHSSLNSNYYKYKNKLFGGVTMTSLPKTEEEITFYNLFMNDKKYITNNVEDLNQRDLDQYYALKEKNLDIFISHYPIITTDTHLRHLNDGSIGSYRCDVSELIAPINFFGHVHEIKNYKFDKYQFYTNALGYPHENLNTIIQEIMI